MRINRGLFLQNNNCGYVLKPRSLRTGEPSTETFILQVSVISGYMLPKPRKSKKGEIVDPFVTCKLIVPDKPEKGYEKYKTKVINDNGFNPVWNTVKSQNHFVFKTKIVMPELSFLSLSIRDKDILVDDLLATATVPFNCLNEGYRLVKLYDHTGFLIPYANLFVHIKINKLLN